MKSDANGTNLERVFTYMKLQKLLDEYKYNKKDQESIRKEIIRQVQILNFKILFDINEVKHPITNKLNQQKFKFETQFCD